MRLLLTLMESSTSVCIIRMQGGRRLLEIRRASGGDGIQCVHLEYILIGQIVKVHGMTYGRVSIMAMCRISLQLQLQSSPVEI